MNETVQYEWALEIKMADLRSATLAFGDKMVSLKLDYTI